jgi:hypothetical protein
MVRHVVLPRVSIAGLLLCTSCTGAGAPTPAVPLDPGAKLELLHHMGGYHGGGSMLKVDHAGRYTYHYSKWDGTGRGVEEECEGGLEVVITPAWIDRVGALRLVPYEETAYRAMIDATDDRTDALYVVYHPSTGAPQMPADASVHDSVREEAREWLSTFRGHRPKSESCRMLHNDFQ